MSSENKDGRVYKYFPLLLSILDELHISNTAKNMEYLNLRLAKY